MKFLKGLIAGIGALTLAFGAQAQTTFNGPGNIPFESYVARLPAPVTINADDTLYLLQDGGSYGVQVGSVFNNLLSLNNVWTALQTFDGNINLSQSVTSTISSPSFSFIGVTNFDYTYNALTSNTNSAMLQVHTIVNGANANVSPAGAAIYGFNSWMEINQQATAPVASYTALGGIVFVNQSITSPTGSGSIAGVNGNVIVLAGVTGFNWIEGGEDDVTIRAGASAPLVKIGHSVALGPDDQVQGSSIDAAFITYAAPPATGPNSPGWKHGFIIDTANFGVPTLDTTVGVAFGLTGSQTMNIGLDLSSGTFNSCAVKSPGGFCIDTFGNITTNGFVASANAVSIPAGGAVGEGYTLFSTRVGMFVGSGVPTLSAAQGSIYLRSDGLPYYNTTGSTVWDQLIALTATQTLTNKTISFSSNTLTGVAPLASPTFSGTVTGPDSGTWGSGGINGSIIGGTTPESITGTAVTVTGALVNSGIGLIGSLTKKGTVCVSTTNEIYYSATTC